MLETEAEVAKEQKELHRLISQEIIAAEKQFHQILAAIKTETNDTNLPLLEVKAKEFLNEIHASRFIEFIFSVFLFNLALLISM